jgi:hypothetical protein
MEDIIEHYELRKDVQFLNYVPEIDWANIPYDRDFFFNILNTL